MGSALWEQPALKGMLSRPGFPALGINVMASMLADRGDEMMVSMRAPGAVDNLQDEGIVLLSAKLFRDGPHPLHFQGVPEGVVPLTRQILDYQKALVHAAVQGTRRDLEAAILTAQAKRVKKLPQKRCLRLFFVTTVEFLQLEQGMY